MPTEPWNRRSFLQRASALTLGAGVGVLARQSARAIDSPVWRTFELVTRIEVLQPAGKTRVWVPVPSISSVFQRTLTNTVDCQGARTEKVQEKRQALGLVCAEFPVGVRPLLTVTSRVSTRDWIVDLSGAGGLAGKLTTEERHEALQATRLVPTDGIVRQRALAITEKSATDEEKARAIYEWIVENTSRDPKTRGCGTGDIRYMLESGNLRGKCADINALFVGLARAAGLPARDAYGIRVAKTQLGCKSLGLSTDNATKAQHCRAEVYLSKHGWVPVDPADVRKVMLEEAPGGRSLDDELVKQARSRLFGSWEMNWIAYNFAQDVTLPGSNGAPARFLMYPTAETKEGRLDSLAPDTFQYSITAKEIT